MASKKEQERQSKRKAGKATYDLPPGLKQAVSDLAAEWGIPVSQAATAVMVCGFQNISSVNFSKYIQRSRSPLYKNKLDIKKLLDDFS